jgi:DNA-binding transcriptional MerR regulator
MYSVGKIAKMFGISRTTLLYYDNIGILSPSRRSEAGYRLYNSDDLEKLGRIMLFKDAGIPLKEVLKLLSNKEDESMTAVLIKQLSECNKSIVEIKKRQGIIVKILKDVEIVENINQVDIEGWNEIFKVAGIGVEAARLFHEEFENNSPQQHQQFLEAIGFDEEEIKSVRLRSRSEKANQ